jgi:hypothetical protein
MDQNLDQAVANDMWISTMNVSMLDQIAVASAASLSNLVIHAFLIGFIASTLREVANTDRSFPGFLQYMLVIVTTGILLVIGHFSECLVWAYTYKWVGAAPSTHDLIYFAAVNYTTLGYGDITPIKAWHLLGPLTALNGAMLIGWSTAVVYDLLQRSNRAST